MLTSSTTRSTCSRASTPGLDHDHRRHHRARRRGLANERRSLRPGDRDLRRDFGSARVAAIDRRNTPVVVAGHLRTLPLGPARSRRLRRGLHATNLAVYRRGPGRRPGPRRTATSPEVPTAAGRSVVPRPKPAAKRIIELVAGMALARVAAVLWFRRAPISVTNCQPWIR